MAEAPDETSDSKIMSLSLGEEYERLKKQFEEQLVRSRRLFDQEQGKESGAESERMRRLRSRGLFARLFDQEQERMRAESGGLFGRLFDQEQDEDFARKKEMHQAACAEGTQKVYRANVIVVGHYRTGKTHLCRNLLGETFTEDDHVTNGIKVSGCILEKHGLGTTWQRKDELSGENYCIETLARGTQEYLKNRKDVKKSMQTATIRIDEKTMKAVLEMSKVQRDVPDLLTLWDFGGQYVFYTTHQTFLTWRAVYLLVFDLTKELTDPVHVKRVGRTGCRSVDSVPDTVGDFLKFWQNSIHTQTEVVKREDPRLVHICPRIILVGTHRDQLGETEEERMRVAKEKFRNIQEFLDGRPAHKMHMEPYFYAVNNCDQQDAEIKKLKEKIWETIQMQPHWGEEQPLNYVLLEKRLKEISKLKKCLSLVDVFQEGKRYGLNIAEKVFPFLRFYSDLRELVFFNEVGIRDIVILDPQWLIDAFASLITVEKYHKVSKPEVSGYWKMLDDRGELDERLIDSVWEKNAELKGNKEILLRICQRFDLLVELPKEEANGQWKKYLVPCVLKSHPDPEGYLKLEEIPPLYLMFDGGFCPPGLFHRLVVCCYRKWSSHDQNPYCDYACFMVDNSTHTILELFNKGDGTLKVIVGSLKSGVNVLDSNGAFYALTYIRQELDRLIGAYFPYLKYTPGFRFPHGLVKLTEYLQTQMLQKDDVCPPGFQKAIETAPYRKWLRKNENSVSPSTKFAVYPSDDLVCELSRKIDVEWEEIGHHLGVGGEQRDHLKRNFPNNTPGQIRNMLFQWRDVMETRSYQERRYMLMHALSKAGRSDLADRL